MTSRVPQVENPRQRLQSIVESPWFVHGIMTLIILNAITFGLETYPVVMTSFAPVLEPLDHIILWIFVLELTMRFAAFGRQFFRDPWSLFDLVIVGIAFVPSAGAMSVLRAARVLRALRLISVFPRLRIVAQGLLAAIPGIGSIGAILITILYVFAVIATKLFGGQYPEWFGTLHASLFSLFQIMTLEGWPDIVRTVLKTDPWAWVFFITYILIATFTVLNLFIAVIVDAMTRANEAQEKAETASLADIQAELRLLHGKLDAMSRTA
jgi:voltage-gated sodium channel